jgi:hypothetical protein
MDKASYPVTPAVRSLREKKIAFEPHTPTRARRTVIGGGTGVGERTVVKR